MKKRNINKFKNIKEILYNSIDKYPDNIAFTTKIKTKDEVKYVDHTYTNLLKDINSFGTSLYKLGLKEQRIAIVGHNSYEWAVSYLSNLLRWNSISSIR